MPRTKSMKALRPLAMHHLLLVQGAEVVWFCRSAFAGDRHAWKEQSPAIPPEDFDPLSAAADVFKRAPRGRMQTADKLTVLLGYPYAQHAVLPWRQGLEKTADWYEYAGAIFDKQCGEDGGNGLSREIVIDPAPGGQPRLAAATDTALMEGLQALARTHALHMVSCTSLLTAAVRRHRDLLEDDCVLSLPQQGSFECLHRKQGIWQVVRRIPAIQVAASSKAVIPAENVVPLLAMMPFTGNPRQAQEKPAAIRWLGTAHPWLEQCDSESTSKGFSDADAEDAVAGRAWRYWRAVDWLEQSGRYGAWHNQAWRRHDGFSTYAVIYCWLGVPLSWWKEGRQCVSES